MSGRDRLDPRGGLSVLNLVSPTPDTTKTLGTLGCIFARKHLRSIYLRGHRAKSIHWSWRVPCKVDSSPEQRGSCLCLFDSAATHSRGLGGWMLGWSHYSYDEWSGQPNSQGKRAGLCSASASQDIKQKARQHIKTNTVEFGSQRKASIIFQRNRSGGGHSYIYNI